MVQDGVRLRNRMIRRLQGAGIKLAAVASDVFGVSGRVMRPGGVYSNPTSGGCARHVRLGPKFPLMDMAHKGL
jgi:hypothetical protein